MMSTLSKRRVRARDFWILSLIGEARPMADKPDEREVLAQGYLAKAAYCEFVAGQTADGQYKAWLERLAREWKEEAATTTRKSS